MALALQSERIEGGGGDPTQKWPFLCLWWYGVLPQRRIWPWAPPRFHDRSNNVKIWARSCHTAAQFASVRQIYVHFGGMHQSVVRSYLFCLVVVGKVLLPLQLFPVFLGEVLLGRMPKKGRTLPMTQLSDASTFTARPPPGSDMKRPCCSYVTEAIIRWFGPSFCSGARKVFDPIS